MTTKAESKQRLMTDDEAEVVGNSVWTNIHKEQLLFRKIDLRYLSNIIGFLEKKKDKLHREEMACSSIVFQGEMAEMYQDQAIDGMWRQLSRIKRDIETLEAYMEWREANYYLLEH